MAQRLIFRSQDFEVDGSLSFQIFSDKTGIEQQTDTIQKHEGAVQHQFTGAVWPLWQEQALICSDDAQDDQDR